MVLQAESVNLHRIELWVEFRTIRLKIEYHFHIQHLSACICNNIKYFNILNKSAYLDFGYKW